MPVVSTSRVVILSPLEISTYESILKIEYRYMTYATLRHSPMHIVEVDHIFWIVIIYGFETLVLSLSSIRIHECGRDLEIVFLSSSRCDEVYFQVSLILSRSRHYSHRSADAGILCSRESLRYLDWVYIRRHRYGVRYLRNSTYCISQIFFYYWNL